MLRPIRLLAPLALLMLLGAAYADPVGLRYDPEPGLRVSYDLEATATVSTRASAGQGGSAKVALTLRRTDVVESVTEDRVKLTRTLENIVLKQDGRPVAGMPTAAIRYSVEFDRRGQLVPGETPALDDLPMAVQQALNLVEFIPFASEPVEIGDEWDASGIEPPKQEGVVEEKSVSEAQLVRQYDDDGMEVALIQQAVEGRYLQAAPEGTPSKGVRITMTADCLQSNRIEDGCLLGVKGTMSMSMDVLDAQGKVMLSNRIDELRATMRVAQ